jgi:hypothetical protein
MLVIDNEWTSQSARYQSNVQQKGVEMRVILMVGAILAAFATPAWASQCPSSISTLDNQMQQHGSMLSPDKAAQVKELRDKAEQAHAAGNHDEAMQAVQQAHSAMGM